MQKILVIVLVVLSIIVVLELSYLAFVVPKSKRLSSPSSSLPSVSPSPSASSPGPDLKIIYQDKADTEGRTVVYEDCYRSKKCFGGAGQQSSKPYLFVVGLFSRWELTDDKNRSLYLTHPLAGGPLEKITITSQTKFGVENLDNPGEIEEQKTARLADIPTPTLNQIIKVGDAIIVFFEAGSTTQTRWLLVRRYGSAKISL